jgi:hypothetical protein
MSDPVLQLIADVTGACSVRRSARIQSVWGGYGELVRYKLAGAEQASVVVKHVRPGKGRGRSHDRKLRSYEVEQTWYRDWSGRCGEACRVARCLHVSREAGEWTFVFEDLDQAGFGVHDNFPTGRRLQSCLRWLAAFHATFMGQRPRGLWKTGTYWHLKTRPDELKAMEPGPLRDAAAAIDTRLNAAHFQTVIHGDAKPENFGFSRDGASVAAVDFQYVGGGCGMKDVAYLLTGEDPGTLRHGLDTYFRALREALGGGGQGAAIEAEWRKLYPWAWADFHRFLAGWSPGWRFTRHEESLTRKVLAKV